MAARLPWLLILKNLCPVPQGHRLISLGKESMRVLYAVFVLSMAVLVWTVISFRRHIRNHDSHPADPLKLQGSKTEDPLKNAD